VGYFILRRVLVSVVILFGISILLFVLVRVMPGDPAEMMLDPFSFTGDRAAALERLRAQLGLDQPLPIQYVQWMSEVLRGNFGYSYADGRPVAEILLSRFGATLRLVSVAFVIGVVVGVSLGIVAALRRNSPSDYTISFVSLLMISVPPFFVALVGIFVFGLTLRWAPTSGINSPSGGDFLDSLRYLALPAAILGLMLAGPYVRYARSSMLDVLNQDYMTTARSKGLPPTRVVLRHGLHNALIPLVTVVTLQIPVLFSGAVIIEQLFSWPGVGRMALDAILARNYPILLGFVMLIAVLVLVCNLIADILYAVIDPRIRL
jgi:ABC-type dipeptide/oligopeptide/nickel transport system permease component